MKRRMSLESEYELKRQAHYKELRKGHPKCKHDGRLLDRSGRCWFCSRAGAAS